MNRKRLIVTSVISILLVSVLLIGSTYSIFTSEEIDETANVYTTGNLDVTYTLSTDNVKLENSKPTSLSNSISIQPYRITVTNNGNVPYQFDIILNDTTASNVIDYQYIMVQVGKLQFKTLADCTNNVIKEDVIVLPNSSVDIDVRVWLSDVVQNSEMGKSFYAKLSIDGLAIYNKNEEIDNSILVAYKEFPLSDVAPGSYVQYVGNNGCNSRTGACVGRNANYVNSTNLGYCNNSTYKYNVSGWRVAYIRQGNAYLISAGSPECMCTNSNGTIGTSCSSYEATNGVPVHLNNLNNTSLKYCNSDYSYNGVCDISSSWNMNADDFKNITGSTLSNLSCFGMLATKECGSENDLIINGGDYWIAKAYDIDNPSWSANVFNSALFFSNNSISNHYSHFLQGIRPVLKLDSSVYVIGGKGTYEDPYRIATDKVKINDLSGNGNHGINRGSNWDKTNGIITTDGSSTYVDVGLANYDFGNSITLVARIKFNEIKTNTTMEFLGNWEGAGCGLLVSANSKFVFNLYITELSSYVTFYSTFTPEVDTWYTVVGTYDGINLSLYVNGQELSLDTSVSGSVSSVSGSIKPSSVAFNLANNPAPSGIMSNVTAATFDSVLIFDRALTAEEIARDYSEEVNPTNISNLLLYYDFNSVG